MQRASCYSTVHTGMNLIKCSLKTLKKKLRSLKQWGILHHLLFTTFVFYGMFRSSWTQRFLHHPGWPLPYFQGNTLWASRQPQPWAKGQGCRCCRHRAAADLPWTDPRVGTDTHLHKNRFCLSRSIGKTSPWHWVSRHPRAEQLKVVVHCSWHRCCRHCCRKTLKHRDAES